MTPSIFFAYMSNLICARARFFVPGIAIFVFLGWTVSAQTVDPWFHPVNPYANNGCFVANDTPAVRQSDENGLFQPPYLATFSGGRPYGGYFFPCMDMSVGYGTSHKDYLDRVIPALGNKITVNVHRPIEFRSIGIEGKWPQRVTVSVDGVRTEVDLENYPGTDTGYSVVSDPRSPELAGKRFSTITVSSDDPDWHFGIRQITYGRVGDNEPQPAPGLCGLQSLTLPAPQNHSEFGWDDALRGFAVRGVGSNQCKIKWPFDGGTDKRSLLQNSNEHDWPDSG